MEKSNYIVAAEGKKLINKDKTCICSEVYLGAGDSADNWTEIDEAEANKIQEKQTKDILLGEDRADVCD